MPGVKALVKRELLVWARKSAGLELEEAAKKVPVKPSRLQSWEEGKAYPTLNQLRKLGKAYKRPIAVFYLPEPPLDFQALRDFRRLPGGVAGARSSELRYEMRRAASRRELALDLYRESFGPPPEFSFATELSDEPEEVGLYIRKFLGVTYETQVQWKAGYESFNQWRLALERAAVLVFQMIDVEVSDARGFSIHGGELPVVVVNIKDSPRARLFTMLHELVHLTLREGGLCDLDEEANRPPEEQRVEVFCNMVAGSTLVPRDPLLAQPIVAAKSRVSSWEDQEIGSLADRFGVSRETLLRRLLLLGRTTESFYKAKRKQYLREYQQKAKQGEGGFAPPYRVAISSAGPLFVRLVLENYYRDNINASDVSDFLNIRLKHLGKIEAAVIGVPGSGAS